MLATQFPDINMVRKLRNERADGNAPLWNNIALNIKCREVSRTGVESPYSIFMNNKGFSHCSVDNRQYRIETDTFLIARPGEMYDLEIDNLHQTEIFNIHINRDFFHDIAYNLTTSSAVLLDEHQAPQDTAPYLSTQLYARDAVLETHTRAIAAAGSNKAAFDRALTDLVTHLLIANEQVRQAIARIPAMTPAVRAELYSRLILAKDLIHSAYDREIDLDELCRQTAMSRFHFLRIFKAVYGITPYQYLVKVRLDKGSLLLRHTQLPVADISLQLGFAYPNSFIKAFRKVYNISPLQYRKAL